MEVIRLNRQHKAIEASACIYLNNGAAFGKAFQRNFLSFHANFQRKFHFAGASDVCSFSSLFLYDL